MSCLCYPWTPSPTKLGTELPITQGSRRYVKVLPTIIPAAYLQAVGGWRQRQAVAQLRTGSSWLSMDTERPQDDVEIPRADGVCQRCSSAAIDDADHIIIDCSALESHRWNHLSLFTTRGSRSSSDFMDQDPMKGFVCKCKKLAWLLLMVRCVNCWFG